MAKTHNDLVKSLLSDLDIATDFLKTQLPKDIQALIAWDTLSVENDALYTKDHKPLETDRLFKAKIQNQTGYIITHIEHQSTRDNTMPLRLWQYMMSVSIRHLAMHQTDVPPIIIPLLIHQNPKPYQGPRHVVDMYPSHLRSLAKKLWNAPFHLLNVVQTDDTALVKHGAAAGLLMVLKTVDLKDPKAWLNVVKYLATYANDYGYKRAKDAMLYLFRVDRALSKNEQLRQQLICAADTTLSPRGENHMSIADYLEQQGIEKGIEKGMEKGMEKGQLETKQLIAVRMLNDDVDIKSIAKFTTMSIHQIQALAAELKQANKEPQQHVL